VPLLQSHQTKPVDVELLGGGRCTCARDIGDEVSEQMQASEVNLEGQVDRGTGRRKKQICVLNNIKAGMIPA
jgi:hypothetical protein